VKSSDGNKSAEARRINDVKANEMIYRTLGSTGEKVSAIGVGGWHLGLKHVDEQFALRIVRSAIDLGMNFLDNCWD
jgi:predicted aldo/keto reductase-like oxidoreductase